MWIHLALNQCLQRWACTVPSSFSQFTALPFVFCFVCAWYKGNSNCFSNTLQGMAAIAFQGRQRALFLQPSQCSGCHKVGVHACQCRAQGGPHRQSTSVVVLYRLQAFWYLLLAGKPINWGAITQHGELVFLTPLLYFLGGWKTLKQIFSSVSSSFGWNKYSVPPFP